METAINDASERAHEDARRRALEALTLAVLDAHKPNDLAWEASRIVGEVLDASRVGYSRMEGDFLVTTRDWTAPEVGSLAGTLSLRSFGTFVDDMVRGHEIAIGDVYVDPRSTDPAGLAERHARAFLNIPVLESGELVAVFFVNLPRVHQWTTSDTAFVREAAARTRTATERLHADAARRQAVEELRALNARLEDEVEARTAERDRMWNTSPDLMVVMAPDGTYRRVNPAWTTLLGYDPAELIGTSPIELNHPDDLAATRAALGVAQAGVLPPFENRIRHKDGGYRWIQWSAAPAPDEIFASGRDITDTREAEERLAEAEGQLRQAQKMEAVGQLTGGLAHDFNNLLTGVMGNLELLQLRVARGRLDDLDRFIHAAQGAGRRAAALTQRLLAFSRRQTLDPKPTDVNRLIAGLEEMLRRTVGATTDIEIVGAAGLWTANIDAGQLENAILNLCINGRDAMSGSGKLTIETANKWIDDRTGRERDLEPGQYISVCVTDTGTGMSPEAIQRAFEPFYTTKPIGQGTGLGLSMIYGFAEQSGGQVRIYSELGQGTTVCIYLPRHHGDASAADHPQAMELQASTTSGTVLVVDDEATIRHLIDEVLDDLGYTVIGAADGAAGLKVLQSGAKIELLITDVGLPNGMNGRQVADAARQLRPGLKVLFITGFAENAAVGNGHLEPGMELLTKPFSLEALSTKVAEMLSVSAVREADAMLSPSQTQGIS